MTLGFMVYMWLVLWSVRLPPGVMVNTSMNYGGIVCPPLSHPLPGLSTPGVDVGGRAGPRPLKLDRYRMISGCLENLWAASWGQDLCAYVLVRAPPLV